MMGSRRMRRAAVAVPTVSGVERRQIHAGDRVEHEPREVILGQPVAQRRRHQQHLIPITRQEVLRHPGIVLIAPDRPPLCNSHHGMR